MAVNRIGYFPVHQLMPQKTERTPAQAGKTFADMLGNAIGQVNQAQIQSDQAAQGLINGDDVNLHNVMIAAEKAQITLGTAVEVRNKVIDAYQSVMRMQV
jgi:flagellar hook-basal body complex protein FliE